MKFNQIKNLHELKYYLANSKSSLTPTTPQSVDFYGVKSQITVIYSYATPIAYIIKQVGKIVYEGKIKPVKRIYYNEILYVLDKKDNYFSTTTSYYMYTLNKIADVLVPREILKTVLRNAGFDTGRL